MKNILIVDDDEKICWAFEQFLTDEGYNPIDHDQEHQEGDDDPDDSGNYKEL